MSVTPAHPPIEKQQFQVVNPHDAASRERAIEELTPVLDALIAHPPHRAVTIEVEEEEGSVILTVHPHVVHKPAQTSPKVIHPNRKVILAP